MRLLFSPAAFSSAATTPVPVLIAGIAIIATRFVGVILLVATLGWGEPAVLSMKACKAGIPA